MSAPELLKVQGLRHRWGEGFELSIESWSLSLGERAALIGLSGAGKSTLLGLIAGLTAVQEGELWVLGAPLHAMTERARRAWRAQHVGLLAQSFELIEHLSAEENCALPLHFRLRPNRAPRGAGEEREALLAELGLTALGAQRPSQLSQGERQRFALARALYGAPALTLADEPTAHLDPEGSARILKLLQRPRAEGGLLVVTHDQDQLDGFDSVWRVERGSLKLVERRVSPPLPQAPRSGSLEERRGGVGLWPLALLGLKATRHYGKRALALALALALTAALPLGLQLAGERLERRLSERAASSPLVLGSPGSRFDLTLRSLYFRGASLKPLEWRDLKRVYQLGAVEAAPLHLRFSAGGAPLIGTSLEYYELRGLSFAEGRAPQRLGELVLGAELARQLKLELGGRLMSDQEELYNLASSYPVELEVVGILAPTQSPDDEAAFTDMKTCWVIEGRGHGHREVEGQQGAELVIAQRLGSGSAPVHFHGDMNSYPVSSILIIPRDEREGSLFKARALQEPRWHITKPRAVVSELLALLFKLKAALSALSLGALCLTSALGALIAWLSFTLRAGEWRALAALGLSAPQVLWAGLTELLWIALLGLLILCASLWLLGPLERLIWSLLF